MPYKLITAPAEEPLTRLEAKTHLRIDAGVTDDDLLIDALITAVRQYAETECQRVFVTQGWQLVQDGFPGYALVGQSRHALRLDRPTVQSIESIQYLDMGSVLQTMPTTDWVADLTSAPARVAPKFGRIWPISLPQIGAVQVNFTAGYGNAAAVPQGIKQWMLLRLAALYENREEFAVLNRGSLAPLPFVDRLLDPFRVVSL